MFSHGKFDFRGHLERSEMSIQRRCFLLSTFKMKQEQKKNVTNSQKFMKIEICLLRLKSEFLAYN